MRDFSRCAFNTPVPPPPFVLIGKICPPEKSAVRPAPESSTQFVLSLVYGVGCVVELFLLCVFG